MKPGRIGNGSRAGFRVSAVVTAYNEQQNIGRLLDSILSQRTVRGRLVEVVVVASGCTDGTHGVVEDKAASDPRVRLVVQNARLGKSAAINAYLRERDPSCDVMLLSSSDVVLQPGFVDLMLAQFQASPSIGMCGGRIVPCNPPGDLMGRVVRYLWEMHHEIALHAPKMGEATMVRANLVQEIPESSAVDEASLEAQVHQRGYWLRYVPEAVVVNRGPDNLREYLRQRRRIASGHYWLRAHSGYTVSTMAVAPLLSIAARKLRITDPATDAAALTAIAAEAVSRAIGYVDYVRGYSHAVWQVAPSTRAAIGDAGVGTNCPDCGCGANPDVADSCGPCGASDDDAPVPAKAPRRKRSA